MVEWLVKVMKGMSFPRISQAPEKKEKTTSFLQKCVKKILKRPSNSVGPLASSRYLLQGDEYFLLPFSDYLDSLPPSSSSTASSLSSSSKVPSDVKEDTSYIECEREQVSRFEKMDEFGKKKRDIYSARENLVVGWFFDVQVVVLKVDLHCKG